MSLLERNYFEVFGLAPAFEIDLTELQQSYLRLQGAVHPDRLTDAPLAHKRIAMQLAAHVNQAKLTLENPLSRAAYLCELNGAAIDANTNTRMPAAFLMQQMDWRDSVAQARQRDAADPARQSEIAQVEGELNQALAAIQRKLASLFSIVPLSDEAVGLVRQWMFLDKLEQELLD